LSKSTNQSDASSVLVSVVVPCFNERATIGRLVERVLDAPFRKELIIVDDGSTDGSREYLESEVAKLTDVQVIVQPHNQGKGAALRRGFHAARGEIVIVQDADLEYDPREIPKVLAPILEGEADVVYGSRFLGGPHRVLYYWHSVGNYLLTTMSNMINDVNLTDVETCYKAFKRDVLLDIDLNEDRFGFEPEITVKIAKRKTIRIFEVPISYHGRTYAEGKKIVLKDAFRALYCLVKYGIVQSGKRPPARRGAT
jgi:glycosyltransferase involved in cell wall biosynthesis